MANMVTLNNSTFFNNASDCGFSSCPISVGNTVILVFQAVNWTLTLPTVSWALWLLLRRSRSTLETELFVFQLLSMDMTSTLVNIGSNLNKNWLGCRIFNSSADILYWLCFYGHPLAECCVCVERYLAVVHPVIFLKYKPIRYKAIVLFLVWIVTLGFSLMYHINDCTYIVVINVFPIVCIESFCSQSILHVLNSSGPGENKGKTKKDREGSSLIKKRAFTIIVILQIKLLVNYLPYIIATFIHNIFSEEFYKCFVLYKAVNICLYGSFIQSFLYLQRTGKMSCIRGV